MIRVCFPVPVFQDPPWFYLLFPPFDHHNEATQTEGNTKEMVRTDEISLREAHCACRRRREESER